MKDKQTPSDFIENYAKISGMDTTQVISLLRIQDKQCTKYSRVKTCLELWNSRDAEINELKSAFGALSEELKESNGEIEALKGEIKKRDDVIRHALSQKGQLYGMPEHEAIKFRERKVFSLLREYLEIESTLNGDKDE